MRFDDRLATVLGQPAMDDHGRAVQWRQLVELVARGAGQGDEALKERALGRIARLMDSVPPPVLAATARAIAGPAVPAELVALFAARGAGAAAALVTAAALDSGGWAAVRAVAAPDVLPLLASLAPESTPAAAPSPPEPAAEPPADPSPEPAGPPPAGLFRWECGPTGEIDWVEGAPRAALIGRSLTEPFADRFAARLPFSDEPLILAEEGDLAGEWRWSGTPAFFPDTGRFAGYRGMARRDGAEPPATAAAAPALPQDDELRELMHELRTPLNAIIGFGEIIEGQYLGPAHRAYRARAATIVREARRLAQAVETLDLAAKLRSHRSQPEPSSGASVIRQALAAVAQQAEARSIALVVDDRITGGELIALPVALTERLVELTATFLIDMSEAGERLTAVLDRIGNQVALGIDRPRQLARFTEDQLLQGVEVPGTRFPLRLVQGLTAMVGGALDIAADRLILLLPLERTGGD
jgi:hypothetical protein